MKTKKKEKRILPEVLILGDLQDVKHLFKSVNKKKSIVMFRDMDQGLHYTEIDGKIKELPAELVLDLEKEYGYIYFDFFPSRKKVELLPKEPTEKAKPSEIKKKTTIARKPAGKRPVRKKTVPRAAKNPKP